MSSRAAGPAPYSERARPAAPCVQTRFAWAQATKQQDPDRLCRCLITVLTEAHDDTLRQQSAVLLRQCLKARMNTQMTHQADR